MTRLLAILLTLLTVFPAHAVRLVPQTAEQITLSFAPLVKQASPAVVNIYTKRKVRVRTGSPLMNDPIFRHFFGGKLRGGHIKEKMESSLGSGVIVRPNGYVITSYHVIKGSDEIRVVLSDRRELEAKIVLSDEKTDLALLKIQNTNERFSFIELMDSNQLEVGDVVLAIGNPFGVGQTVTSGIVSALARTTLGITDYQFFIQTDAAINPGNSGGALINSAGKLVGINTAIFSRSGGSNGIGFAIPANMVDKIITTGVAGNKLVRPWLGAGMQMVTSEIANSIGLTIPKGALISQLHQDSPLKNAGLKTGDVITAIDGKEVNDPQALRFQVGTYELREVVRFDFIRNNLKQTTRVKMVAAPETPKRDSRTLKGMHPLDGAVVENLSPAVAEELGVDSFARGVAITSIKQGKAARAGFQKKDIIQSINGQNITSSGQLASLLKTEQTAWRVTIKRGERVLTIALNIR